MQESQMSLQDLQNDSTNTYDPTVSHDDFIDQMLSGLQTAVSWPDISAGNGQNKPTLPWGVDQFDDQSAFLSSKLHLHQITATVAAGGGRSPSSAVKPLQIHDSSFKSPIGDNNNSIQNLFHGLTGSLTSNQTPQFRNLPVQNFGSPGSAAAVMTATATSGGGGAPSQARQRVRARRGQATDPHSIAERLRRERIAERMKALQELVPNANKTDKASMLDEIIDYVKFLQLQVKVLSMSRLGGAGAGAAAAAVAPVVAENGGGIGRSTVSPASNNESMTVTENQVVKLMEQDMGSAMQYLQGKGLCLMPISLATAMSTATCHNSGTRSNHQLGTGGGEGGGPPSPNMSVLTVQSGNGVSAKDSS